MGAVTLPDRGRKSITWLKHETARFSQQPSSSSSRPSRSLGVGRGWRKGGHRNGDDGLRPAVSKLVPEQGQKSLSLIRWFSTGVIYLPEDSFGHRCMEGGWHFWGGTFGTERAEAGVTAKHPTPHGAAPPTEYYPVHNVASVQVEKLCSKLTYSNT